MNKRFVLSVGIIVILILMGHFGDMLLNGIAVFLLAGVIRGTSLVLPSTAQLGTTLSLLIVMVAWLSYKIISIRPPRHVNDSKLDPSD